MESSNSFLIAISLGLVSHSLIHLAKSMQRHGIEVFDKIRAKIKNTEDNVEEGGKKSIIYTIGFILNQTPPLWAFLVGLTGAPMSYYTSVYGVGLIVSLIYSAKILKEKIQKIEYIGAFVLISGIIMLGIDGVMRPPLSYADIILERAFLMIGVIAIIGITSMIMALKTKSPLVIGIVFGLFSGCIGCLDPVFKGIGQNYGGSGGLPSGPIGWTVFIFSFGLGFVSFMINQWAFARKADSIVVIPCINTTYVMIPILLQAFALPGFNITVLTIIGLIVTISGIFMMTFFKKRIPTQSLAIDNAK